MLKFIIALIAIIPLISIKGYIVIPQTCQQKNMSSVPNFDINQFLGVWWITDRSYFDPYLGDTCARRQYSLSNTTGWYLVDEFKTNAAGVRIKLSGNGTYFPSNGTNSPQLDVRFRFQGVNIPLIAQYWPIYVNYNENVVLWMCVQLPQPNRTLTLTGTFVLSRTPSITNQKRNELRNVIANHGINTNFMLTLNNPANCNSTSIEGK